MTVQRGPEYALIEWWYNDECSRAVRNLNAFFFDP